MAARQAQSQPQMEVQAAALILILLALTALERLIRDTMAALHTEVEATIAAVAVAVPVPLEVLPHLEQVARMVELALRQP